jgi:hypothetical protein
VQGFWLQQVAMLQWPEVQAILSEFAFFFQPLGHLKSAQVGPGVVVTVVTMVQHTSLPQSGSPAFPQNTFPFGA